MGSDLDGPFRIGDTGGEEMKHDRNKYLEQRPAHLIKEYGEEKADEPKAYDIIFS